MNNTTWIAGTPRTGSMLTFNITREIFRSNGRNIKPLQVPQSDQDMLSCFLTEANSDVHPSNQYIFKVHTLLKTDLPKSKYIVNIRNPFDICASFYQFMKRDINRAINVAKGHSLVIKHYQNCAENQIIFIRFEDLEKNLASEIEKISIFLDIKLDSILANIISSKFSKSSVSKLIDQTTKNLEKKISLNQLIKDESIVKISADNYRAFDVNTGFQTGHISNRNSGEWHKLFNQKEIYIIKSELLDHAEQLGYQY